MGYIISSGDFSSGIILENDSMTIFDGGIADTTTVSRGSMFVSSGGTANSTMISTAGKLRVSSGGIANNTIVSSGGSMFVSDGGQANNTTVSGGYIFVYDGGLANNTTVSGGTASMCILSGGTAIGTTVSYGGNLYVSSGGTAVEIKEDCGCVTVADGADVSFASCTLFRKYLESATVHSGTTAVSTTIYTRSGAFFIYSSGIANDTCVSSGMVYINAGGIANNTIVSSGGSVFVSSGGTANGTVINYHGGFIVSSGGTANGTAVKSGGVFTVSANVTVNSTNVYYSGNVNINAGGIANDTSIYAGGKVNINDGGIANDTTVCSSGILFVASGGTANAVTVRSGGSLSNNGKLTGRLTIQQGTNIYAASDSILDFDLSCVSPGDAPLVNDLSRLTGSPALTITVSDGQAHGVYALADGAEQFGGTITVVGTTEEVLGTLAVGESVEIDGVSYTLFLTGGNLSLAVGCEPPPLSVSSGVIIQANETRYVNSGEVYYSTTVSENGYLVVNSGGTADLAFVSGGGYLQVSGGGIAKRISANGKILIFSGGMMNEVALRGGDLQVFDGGTVSGVSMNGGHLQVIGGGTVGDVIMNGGSIRIDDGGTLNDVYGSRIMVGSITNSAAVSSDTVEVFSGGTARNINDRIAFLANSAAYFYSGNRLEVYSGGTAHGAAVQNIIVSSGGTADNTTVFSGGSMVVSSGGIANHTIVNDSGGTSFSAGLVTILAGGLANDTTVSHGGVLRVSSGGTADNATVFDADIYVSSGGTANNVSVDPAGLLLVSRGGTASGIMENGGCVIVEDGADVSFASNTFSRVVAYYDGWMITVHSGTTAYSVNVENAGTYHIFSGGTAFDTIVSGSNGKGEMDVEGTAFDTIVSSGKMVVFSGGTAFDTIVSGSGGSMYVSSGGTADNTSVTDRGIFYVDGPDSSGTGFGGTANNTVVNSYCSMNVARNGIANDTTLNDSGSLLRVNSGGTANDTTINGGSLQISSGGTANDTTLNYGTLYISGYNEQEDQSYSGPRASSIANNTTINRGRLEISGRCAAANGVLVCSGGNLSVGYGAVANGVTVSSGGKLFVSSGGSLSGRMTFESRAIVSMFNGSFLDFDLTQTSAGAAALVNNLSLVTGYYNVTLTVDAEQPKGLYLLAEGAAKFGSSKPISVRNATTQPGQSLGTLYVGDTVQIENREYALSLSDGVLALSVSTVSGGVISSGTVDIGDYEVYSGAVVRRDGRLNVSQGKKAVDTTISSGGRVYVSSGGTASHTTVRSGGSLIVLSGGTATEILENGGYVDVASDANARFGQATISGLVLSSASATVHSATTARLAEVGDQGSLTIYSGGRAISTTVSSGGHLYVSSGGTANSTTVNSGGSLFVSSGGIATKTVWTPCEGHVFVAEGGSATFASEYSGVYFGSNGQLLSQAMTMDGVTIGITGEMNVMSGGSADNTSVLGLMYVSGGGTANDTTISSGGSLFVSSGGTANDTIVRDKGRMIVSIGGTANGITVDYNGTLYVSGGGTAAEIVENGGFVSVVNGANVTFRANMFSGLSPETKVTVHSGTIAYDTTLNSIGQLIVYSGGIADNTTINSKGILYVSSGGIADNTTINSKGTLYVSSGGTIYNTTINDGAVFYVLKGGTANNVTVNPGGRLEVDYGGTATIAFSPFGRGTITSGTFYDITYLERDANIYYGNVVSGTISSGNTVMGLAVESGFSAIVYQDGLLADFSVDDGGGVTASRGAKLTGRMTFDEGAFVHANGAILDFDLTQTSAGAAALVNDLSIVQGIPVYTITVDGSEASGTYRLADGVPFFDRVISVVNTSGRQIGSLLAGQTLETNNNHYTLNVADDSLTLTIAPADTVPPGKPVASADITTPTNGDVLVTATFSEDSAICEYSLNGENWSAYPGGVLLTSNRKVYFRAIDAAGNVSEVAEYQVTNIDRTAPGKPVVTASVTTPTNRSVTISAEFDEDSFSKEYSFDGEEWLSYTDAILCVKNETVSFRGIDEAGNVSEVASIDVNNIDTEAPTDPAGLMAIVSDRTVALVWNASTDNTGVKEYIVRYSPDGREFISTRTAGTSFVLTDADFGDYRWSVQAVDFAGNESAVTAGDAFTVSGFKPYIVEYSADNFDHVIRFTVTTPELDTFRMPGGTYQMRVRQEGSSEWLTGDSIVAAGSNIAPQLVRSNDDGNADVFFAAPVGTWDDSSYALHMGALNDWNGTRELISADGRGRIRNLFFGSADPNVLCLTDADNGDAIFVDDVYTDLPEGIEEQVARLYRIQEIRAGAGDDIVDMTSQRVEYVGDGLTIRGGDGDDVIWANKGDNLLFGDAGNDRIVGASGNDVIAGGIGNDSMHGGGGDDVFTFCENWGKDTIKQLAGSVTLWFAAESEGKVEWDEESRSFTDGTNSVAVNGVSRDRITLKFGDDGSEQFASLASAGAFAEFASRRIFEKSGEGMLACP